MVRDIGVEIRECRIWKLGKEILKRKYGNGVKFFWNSKMKEENCLLV